LMGVGEQYLPRVFHRQDGDHGVFRGSKNALLNGDATAKRLRVMNRRYGLLVWKGPE